MRAAYRNFPVAGRKVVPIYTPVVGPGIPYVRVAAVADEAVKSTLCQWDSSLRADRTLASSWFARGRASGSEASMSKSREHMDGPGGGGSEGALLNFIGILSCRSAFSQRASPSGISQPERPLHT